MRRIATLAIFLGFLTMLASAPAHAQATRTWVSGVGDDANPCSRTAPCKTFAGAISKTAAGGEIDCLDPGGFGTLTITKSITLDCGGGGIVGSILASAVNGINVSAAGANVILRNLSINGAGTTLGNKGISITAAASVTIERTHIFNFVQQCVLDTRPTAGKLVVTDVDMRFCGISGIATATSGGTLSVAMDNVRSSNSSNGVTLSTNTNASITRCVFSDNSGVGLENEGAQIFADNCQFSNNATGVNVLSGGTSRLSNNSIAWNSSNAISNGAGSVFVYGNNMVVGSTSGTITPASPQ